MRRPVRGSSRLVPALGIIVTALFLFIVYRAVTAGGWLAHPAPVSPGICRSLPAPQGPRDFAADPAGDAMIVAAQDGLFLVRLADPAAQPAKIAGTPADFHPRAISLYRAPDGAETLMAINAKANGRQAVDIFTLNYANGAPRLTFQSAIEGGLLTSGSGIFAIAPDRFYATNAFGTGNSVARTLENALVLPLSKLLYFDSASFKVAVEQIAYPSAVLVTPDGANIYVASANERRLLSFSREPFTGTMAETGSLALPARPMGLSLDGKDLLVAGQTREAGPSQVLRVRLGEGGVPQSYGTVYAGDDISGATAALLAHGRLFIGSASGNRILVCDGK